MEDFKSKLKKLVVRLADQFPGVLYSLIRYLRLQVIPPPPPKKNSYISPVAHQVLFLECAISISGTSLQRSSNSKITTLSTIVRRY